MKTPCRIALVEDDLDLLKSTEEFLSVTGYDVWGASSAEAFFRQCVIRPVDIVVLDIGLPGEDGLSVANLLRKNPSIAVIILSARDRVEDRLTGLRAGADRYLVKPVNLMELAANIDAVASRLALAHHQPVLELPRQATLTRRETDDHSDHWCLSIQDWVLCAPGGKSMQLTAREFALVHGLIKVQGQAVPKKTLIDDIFGGRITNGSERINVLLARLRKKAADQLTDDLPIKTAHQIGYAFTAPAYLIQLKVDALNTL